ncbi:hypothetical protein BC826DRAFT_591591 [Russula brevipes]|nr:hypothetical protein BC826DRAFT_591591 [Russula brevipes]
MGDPTREMEDVHKCMAVLKAAEGRWHAAGRLWDVLYELASVGNLPLPLPSPPSAKRERDSDSPASLQSSTSAGTQPQQQPQPQRVSVSPATSSLGGGSSGTPFTDQLYSHAPEVFAQQPPPDILSHPPQTQTFAYPHLPTHSDELGRVPGHVFHSPAETWLAPAQGHTQRHQPHQHAAGPIYAQPTASHQATSYGTPQGAEAYTTFVGPPLGAAVPASSSSSSSGQVHDGNVDIWHTMPSGYELEDWDTYISRMSGLAHSHSHSHSTQSHSAHLTHPPAPTATGGSGQGPAH